MGRNAVLDRKCISCGSDNYHAKGYCYRCYKREQWTGKVEQCKRCKREIRHHAQGYCASCYSYVFNLEDIRRRNTLKYHNISLELYDSITKSCIICGFDKIVELHHTDGNHDNNAASNLVGLCPNHHKMYHKKLYREEIVNAIKEKFPREIGEIA